MKWIFPILFLVAFTASNGQSKDSVLCLPKSDIITLANKIQVLKDSVHNQNNTIIWQGGIIIQQDTLIGQQKQRFSLYETQLENRQNTIKLMDEENKKLRETINLMMPKWYDNKWLWFGGGATVATIILGLVF